MAQTKRLLATAAGGSRRELLKGLAALAASGWVPEALSQPAGSAAVSGPQLAALSKSITGYAYGDRRVADAMLRALRQAVGEAKLARLAKLAATTPARQLAAAVASANLESAARTVVAALYTGVVETPQGVRVVSYDQALVWQALTWTKPNAFCGGATNYWASAPSAQSS